MTVESTMSVKTVPRYSEFVGYLPLSVLLSLNPSLAALYKTSVERGNHKYLQKCRPSVTCWKALAQGIETLSEYSFISGREEERLNGELQN